MVGSFAQAQEQPEAPGLPPAGIANPDPAAPEEPAAAAATPPAPPSLFPNCCIEKFYDWLQCQKKQCCIPVTIGAWNWEHVNSGGPNETGYGIPPNLEGTYFWYADIDPSMTVDWGPIKKIGVHTEMRWREEDKFRAFLAEQFWTYENYAYVETTFGTFKGGQIRKQFGFEWDGSFWGPIEYFDGFMLNPSYGVDWEKTWKVSKEFSIYSVLQFLFHDDRVAGSESIGSTPEAQPFAHERNSGVARVVGTYDFSKTSNLAVGLSGTTGEITDILPTLPTEIGTGWCADAIYTLGHLQLLAEVLQFYGIMNAQRYDSGGPSDRLTDAFLGVHYQMGPVLFRVSYSVGFDDHPYGWQRLWEPGVTVALTKNVDFYADYVRWDVYHNETSGHAVFENGVQLVINWRF